jgi:hypothetical protein
METRNSMAIHKILKRLKHNFVNKFSGCLPPWKKNPVGVNADAPPACKLQISDNNINMNASTWN